MAEMHYDKRSGKTAELIRKERIHSGQYVAVDPATGDHYDLQVYTTRGATRLDYKGNPRWFNIGQRELVYEDQPVERIERGVYKLGDIRLEALSKTESTP